MKKVFLLVIVFLFFVGTTYSQKRKFNCDQTLIEELASNKISLDKVLKKNNGDTLLLINCIHDNCNDSLSEGIAIPLISILKKIASETPQKDISKGVIKTLILNLYNKNSKISLSAIEVLRSFPKEYFDSSDVISLSQCISEKSKIYKEIVLFAGFIGDRSLKDKINSIFPSSRNFNKTEKWATYLALARMGNQNYLNYCVSKVASLPLNDDVIDILYSDLIYIHKKETYDLLIKSIYINDKLCSSSNPNVDSKIICGYRIMELLAPVIENFPIKLLPSGDINTNNYSKSLEITRIWLEENKNNYIIIDNKY